jgi:hypothetical protein
MDTIIKTDNKNIKINNKNKYVVLLRLKVI